MMKNYLTLLFITCFFSCTKVKKYTRYNFTLNYDSLTINGYLPHSSNDTVMGYSDSNAYMEAYIKYDARRLNPVVIKTGVAKNFSFNVSDTNRIDLTIKISKKYIDSVNSAIDKICEHSFTTINDNKSTSSQRSTNHSDNIDQDKVIGGINFGMPNKIVAKLITKFERQTNRPLYISHIKIDKYFIGNFEYFQIIGDYDNNKLWQLTVMGLISWEDYDNKVSEQLESIKKVLSLQYGIPELSNPPPAKFQMQKGYEYLVYEWNIGKKNIDINIQDNGDSYLTLISFYQPKIKKQLALKDARSRDSSNKEGSKLFN
jgi:hypothetical protein